MQERGVEAAAIERGAERVEGLLLVCGEGQVVGDGAVDMGQRIADDFLVVGFD